MQLCCVHVHTYATQGWEDVAHLKDELLTQQRKVDQLQTELADLEKAENSLKVWAGLVPWNPEEEGCMGVCSHLPLLGSSVLSG